MKNKFKKSIKYIVVFASVFVLAFCSLSICSLGAENEELEFSFYATPVVYVWNGEDWEKLSGVNNVVASSYTDTQRLTITFDNYATGFEVGKFYRVSLRFRLQGEFLYSTACSFDMRFSTFGSLVGVGGSNGEFNPNVYQVSNSKKSQSYGNIWYKEDDFSRVTDNATLKSFTVAEQGYNCSGYSYSYPIPSLKNNIQAYQLSFGFIVTSQQINQARIVMENFSFPISLPDFSNTAINEYENIENDIILGTQEGRDGAVSIFNSAGGFINNRGNGIMVVGSILNEFFQITALSELVNIALALGLFAFVVGMSVMLVRNVKSKKEE